MASTRLPTDKNSNFSPEPLDNDTTKPEKIDHFDNSNSEASLNETPPTSEDEKPRESKTKSAEPGHGNRFQLKLLMLFWIRAMSIHGASFYLGYELSDVGQKFDDIILFFRDDAERKKYENKTKTLCGYQFLQAKHRLNEKSKIIADQLLDIPKDNDFSLLKYFRSYLAISQRGDSIRNCFICTNVGFNEIDLKNGGIELKSVEQSDCCLKILDFEQCVINSKNPGCYKFKVTDNIKMRLKSVNNGYTDEEIEDFFNKLIFAVNTPNESELDIVLTREIGKRLQVSNANIEYCIIMNEIVKWFKEKHNTWLSAEEGEKLFIKKTEEIMALRLMITISSNYQNGLKEILGFDNKAIDKLAERLELFLDDSSKKFQRITSTTPDFMAVKIISAVEKLFLNNKDNYLVITPKCMEENKEELNKALNAENTPVRLVVVVNNLNDNSYYENLIKNAAIKIILIVAGDTDKFEPLIYEDLSEKTREIIESREVLFQGTYTTVKGLIGENTNLEDVIDFTSIQELLMSKNCKNNQIIIPALNPQYFKLIDYYIQRRITFPYSFDDEFWNQLSKELDTSKYELKSLCKIGAQGHIKWITNDYCRKSEIWEKIKTILNNGNFKSVEPIAESELISQAPKSRVVILTGVAGTGKSTVLSSLYQQIIKQSNQTNLVIKMNFTDESITKFRKENFTNVIDFFITRLLPSAISSSPFAQSLIRHRLQTRGGIVLMMDGFDEIDGELQEKSVEFMKAILQTKLDRLYVTSRPHLIEKLEDAFHQFTYKLENFSEKDQIDYLCKYWQTDIRITSEVKSFAELLVTKVAETLKDEEKAFVGIPLQCKILAECFTRRLKEVLHNEINMPATEPKLEDLITGNKFDLFSLYKQMIDTKEQIFREKQATKSDNFSTDNVFAKLLLRIMNEYHTKLALRTIVSDSSVLDSLWPPSSSLESEDDKQTTKRDIEETALMFGLTCKKSKEENRNELEFIHRTFAEYLVAKYLYDGLLLDDTKANKLLENYINIQFFVDSVLVLDEYDGVRTFLDSMLCDTVESKKWDDMVQNKSLPKRFQDIACGLENRTKKFQRKYGADYEEKVVQFILRTAVTGKHSNIFRLISDCLDTTQNSSVVRSIMCEVFKQLNPSCTDQSKKEIEKFLFSYEGDKPDEDHMSRVMRSMPPNRTYAKVSRPSYSNWDKPLPFSYWNQKEKKANVNLALDFLLQNYKCVSDDKCSFSITLSFFIWNDYQSYDSLVQKFVDLLSRTWDDESLTDIFKSALYTSDYETNYPGHLFFDKRIQKFLTMLQKLERHDVVRKLSCLLLMIAPNIFKKVYITHFNDDASSDNNLLTPNSLGFTRLHKAAFETGNANTIREFVNDCGLLKNNLVKILMDKDLGPLYVAAACKNKDAFYEMLSFLKKELTAKKMLHDFISKLPNGFMFSMLRDASLYGSIEMFKLILTAIKEVLGQNGLLALFRLDPNNKINTENSETVIENSVNRLEPSQVLIMACQNKELMRVIAETLDNGYKILNEFLLKIDYNEKKCFPRFCSDIIFKFGEENLLGMIKAEGFSSWLKLVLNNTGLQTGFYVFSEESFLNFMRNNGLVTEFVQTIFSSSSKEEEAKGGKMSYWIAFFSDSIHLGLDRKNARCLNQLLKCISEDEHGQERLNDAALHTQYKLYLIQTLMKKPKDVFEILLKYLSEQNRKEVCARILNYLSTMTLPRDQFLMSKVCPINNVIWFLSRYHFESYTGDAIIQILLSTHDCEDGKKRSIWSLFIESFDTNNKELENFLDLLTEKLGKGKPTTNHQIKNLFLHIDGSGIVKLKADRHDIILSKYLNKADRNEVWQRHTSYHCFKTASSLYNSILLRHFYIRNILLNPGKT